MIQSVTAVNTINGSAFSFNTDNCPMQTWTMDVDLRQEDRERPLEHGLYESYTYYGRRTFHGEGQLLGDNATNYMTRRMDMQRALIIPPRTGIRSPIRLDLQFDGLGDLLRSYCTLDGYPELPMAVPNYALTDFMVSFKSFDPILYTAAQRSASIPAPTIATGAPFPLIFPIDFSSSSGTDGLARNNGNITTYPQAVITGPVTNPVLININTDETLRFDGLILNSGDSITVDFKQRVAISSSGGNFYGTITSDSVFWTLEPGDTTFRYTADRASAPSTLTLYWYDAYML